jgi:E3 ubiquitin-protein ligase BRE1
MTSKRPAADSSEGSSEPPTKKASGFLLSSNPITKGAVSTEEELDIKVLKVQNARLYTSLEERKSQEEEFKGRLARTERIHKNDQNIISAMNISWNQLDEDVTLMLQRFQSISQEEPPGMSETTVAFLEKLSNRTSKGIQEECGKRVMHTGIMVKKLVKALEVILLRSLDISEMVKVGKHSVLEKKKREREREERAKAEDGSSTPTAEMDEDDFDFSSIELAIRQENAIIKTENKRLNDLMTELHNKYATMSSEFIEIKDNLASAQKENTELHAKQVDMEYDLQKATKQFEKLIKKLSMSTAEQSKPGVLSGSVGNNSNQESVKEDMEAKDELAKNRLGELEKLHDSHLKLAQENERLRQQLLQVPDDVVTASGPFKTLQAQFNLLYNDSQVMRKNCEDARRIVINNRAQHLGQIEQLEQENMNARKKVRAEITQLEKALTESRKELELLRVEYEHNMKAHEQIGPMAKEMRHLINSLQNHNQQLKGEVQRFKRKLTEAETKVAELEKTTKDVEDARDAAEYIDRMETLNASPRSESSQSSNEGTDCDDVKVLRTKLKSAREKRKEMKLLLDMYKGVSKETRDKVELLKNEKTLKDEVQALKSKLLVITEDVIRQSKKFADADHIRQCRKLEGKMEELQKTIANMKQEEDALLAEMEFTG